MIDLKHNFLVILLKCEILLKNFYCVFELVLMFFRNALMSLQKTSHADEYD